MPERKSQSGLWSLLILFNLLILGGIGIQMVRGLGPTTSPDMESLGWSDPAPHLGTWLSIQGRQVALDPSVSGTHLVLIFFDVASAGPVQSLFGELGAALPADAPVQLVGVFAGAATSLPSSTQASDRSSAQLIADPSRSLRRALRLADDDPISHTVVIGPDGRVGLIFQGVLPSHPLLDYLWREALGREDPAPRPSTQDLARNGEPDWMTRVTPTQPVAQPIASEPLPTRLDSGGFRPVKSVSNLSVFRLRRGSNGQFFALSRSESRIFVLDSELRLIRTLGGFGQAPGQLMMPSDLAVDSAGNLIILDAGNGRIQALNPYGEPLLSVPIQADTISLTSLGAHELLMSMPGVGSAFARLDTEHSRPQAKPFGDFWKIPWLQERIDQSFARTDRRRAYEGLEAALNRAYVRSDAHGGFIAVPIWEPRLRRYSSDARLVAEKQFTFSGIEEKRKMFEETLHDALENRHLGILHLFQDLAFSLDSQTLALTVLGTCPGLLLLTPEGDVTQQLCLSDENGLPIAPVTAAHSANGTWWVANSSGIYRLDLG